MKNFLLLPLRMVALLTVGALWLLVGALPYIAVVVMSLFIFDWMKYYL